MMTIAHSELSNIVQSGLVRNAIIIDVTAPVSEALISSISAACDRAEDDGVSARLLIYMQGGLRKQPDATRATDKLSLQLVSSWERTLRRVEQLPGITLGVADGACGTTALEVILCCDVRFATKDMYVFRSQTSLAWPGMFVYRMAREVGIAKARSLLREVELSAQDAATVGLIQLISSTVAGSVRDFFSHTHDAAAMSTFRKLLCESLAMTYEEAVGIHLAACDRFLRSER